jgi:hypothetical protein
MSAKSATVDRIHGELLKLGFEVAQSTVSKYMTRRWELIRRMSKENPLWVDRRL